MLDSRCPRAARAPALHAPTRPARELLEPYRRRLIHVPRLRAGIHRERGALPAFCELLRRGRMPVLAVAAELGPVARLAVPVAELDAQRSLGFRRDRESVPGTRIDRHDLRRDRYHVMVAPEPLHVGEAFAFGAVAGGHAG